MTLEQQVTSLEISKRLKELEVKQESLFYWEGKTLVAKTTLGFTTFGCEGTGGEPTWYPRSEVEEEQFSAFTASELGEMLPQYIILDGGLENYSCELEIVRSSAWRFYYGDMNKEYSFKFTASTNTSEANARGEFLVYLLENKLI